MSREKRLSRLLFIKQLSEKPLEYGLLFRAIDPSAKLRTPTTIDIYINYVYM